MVLPIDKALDHLKSPTHLEIKISPGLQDKFECQRFTKCMVFHVQMA
jgi:hypothetical protein